MSETLFPDLVPVVVPEPESVEGLSADRRRTLRQRADVERGRHPLTGGRLTADPDARCGNCRFRELIHHHNRTYPKCWWTPPSWSADDYAHNRPPRHSNGAASDVRAWWPGCIDHEWGDPKVGPDAMRSPAPAASSTLRTVTA